MSVSGTPEAAIGAFERLHRLRVTVHDLRGTLRPYLAGDRYHHALPVCQAVKIGGGERRCVALEVTNLAGQLPRLPEGRVHVCHAGLVEWVMPVIDAAGVAWVLFAGVRRPGKSLQADFIDPPSAFARSAAMGEAEIETDDAADILEHLRQLAARLTAWASPLPLGDAAGRRVTIQRYLASHHREQATLEGLANELQVSPSRASHIVREVFGRSFRDLLTDARLHTASALLRGTTLPVIDVALRSGFGEVGQFHRLFRQRMNTTPRRFRLSVDS